MIDSHGVCSMRIGVMLVDIINIFLEDHMSVGILLRFKMKSKLSFPLFESTISRVILLLKKHSDGCESYSS